MTIDNISKKPEIFRKREGMKMRQGIPKYYNMRYEKYDLFVLC